MTPRMLMTLKKIPLLPFLKQSWRMLLSTGCGIIFFLSFFVLGIDFNNNLTKPASITNTTSDKTVLTQKALDDLVQIAANEKYQEKVLDSLPILPGADKSGVIAKVSSVENPESRPITIPRCNYNGQNYVEGDIVKTDKNWVRCTPAMNFANDHTSQKTLVWIEVS